MATRKKRAITTKTQAVSFDLAVYDVLESQREKEGLAYAGKIMSRSGYIRLALVEHFRKVGAWTKN
jgi:GTP-sensing pleiotropic transcriptional regulator CodY